MYFFIFASCHEQSLTSSLFPDKWVGSRGSPLGPDRDPGGRSPRKVLGFGHYKTKTKGMNLYLWGRGLQKSESISKLGNYSNRGNEYPERMFTMGEARLFTKLKERISKWTTTEVRGKLVNRENNLWKRLLTYIKLQCQCNIALFILSEVFSNVQ